MMITIINAQYVSQMTIDEKHVLRVWLNGQDEPSTFFHATAEEAEKTAGRINSGITYTYASNMPTIEITIDESWNVKKVM